MDRVEAQGEHEKEVHDWEDGDESHHVLYLLGFLLLHNNSNTKMKLLVDL